MTEAVVLGRDGDDVLLFVDRPLEPRREATAVLICPPFGWQADCAYRGIRTWALALSRAGHPVARLTLPAQGDSAGSPRDPGRVTEWRTAIADAAAWLRDEAGAARVAALGLGLGGSLAALATADGAAIDDLILWAVPARGRALLRELRGLHRIISSPVEDEDHPEIAGVGPGTSRMREFVGYGLDAPTVADLEAIDLAALSFPTGPRRALLLGRDGIAADRELAATLHSAGWTVAGAEGSGYSDLMANPQQSRAPDATIAVTAEWLGSPVAGGAAHAAPASPTATSAGGMVATARASLRTARADDAPVETPMWLPGEHGRLFGVLTEPAAGAGAGLCVVLLGAGALPHTGPNRSWVDDARRWATVGVSTLRVDLSGVGESDGASPDLLEDASFYAPWRDREVAAILDALQARGTASRFVLGGLCSGAYRGLRRALDDERVAGLLLVNLYAFDWSPELVEERGRRSAVAHGLPNARGRSIDREFLAKAMKYLRPDRAWRLLRGSTERRQRRETIRILDRLEARGVQTLLLLGEGEPLATAMERSGLTAGLDRWPSLQVRRVPSRDHMYRALWLQQHVGAECDTAIAGLLRTAEEPRGPEASSLSRPLA